MNELENYENRREDAQQFYSGIRPIFSPALGSEVHFSADGFNHIIFKTANRERDRKSQITRFNMLSRAVKLIGISTTYQEYEAVMHEFEIRRNKRRIRISKSIIYWGIIAIIENRKIKIIVRKTGYTGKLYFWSVIPAWTTNRYRDVKFSSTAKGNLEED